MSFGVRKAVQCPIHFFERVANSANTEMRCLFLDLLPQELDGIEVCEYAGNCTGSAVVCAAKNSVINRSYGTWRHLNQDKMLFVCVSTSPGKQRTLALKRPSALQKEMDRRRVDQAKTL